MKNSNLYQNENEISPKKCTIDYNHLKFDKIIGTGGYGDVYLGIYEPKNIQVAIKKLNSQEISNEVQSEIRLHSSLSNKFILPFIGYTQTFPTCIVTEYMPNGTLYDLLHNKNDDLKLSSTDLTLIAFGIAFGMEYLHSLQLIHKDLKSSNILLDQNFLPKISDFGISSRIGNINNTNSIGTVSIMAPELFKKETFDQSVDVYSYGILLWEMITKLEPFSSYDSAQIIYNVLNKEERPIIPNDTPTFLKTIIQKCWSTNPKDRPTFSDIVKEFFSGQLFFKFTNHSAISIFFSNYGIKKPFIRINSAPQLPKNFISNISPSLLTNQEEDSKFEFEVPTMTSEEIIKALSNIDDPIFETALDCIEENINIIKEIGSRFWNLFLPLILISPQKFLKRIVKVMLNGCKMSNILCYIINVSNLNVYITADTLEIFLYIISFYPQVINSKFIVHLQVLVLTSQIEIRSQSLIILCKILELNNEISIRQQIIDFFLTASDKFVELSCGYLSCKAVATYRFDTQCTTESVQNLGFKFIKSIHKENIIAGYQVLLSFSTKTDLIPINLCFEHILMPESPVRDLAIEFIRRNYDLNDIEIASNVVLSLIKCFELTRSKRAELLLCYLADQNQISHLFFREIVTTSLFLISNDSASDLLTVVVLVLKINKKFFSNHPLLPNYMISVLRYGNEECFSVLCLLFSSLNFDDDSLNNFEKNNVIYLLCLRICYIKNLKVLEYAISALNVFIDKKYCILYPQIILNLNSYLKNDSNIYSKILYIIQKLFKYEPCKDILRDQEFKDLIPQINNKFLNENLNINLI